MAADCGVGLVLRRRLEGEQKGIYVPLPIPVVLKNAGRDEQAKRRARIRYITLMLTETGREVTAVQKGTPAEECGKIRGICC